MNNNSICPKCGGQVTPYDYVCDFCGNVMFNNIKTTDSVNPGTLSFDDGMGIIQQNMNALHDIPKPTAGKAITSALRIILAFYTIGIILIFWKRPKKRFNKEIYGKLKQIILRNINFLKISSKGNQDLMNRIKVYEDEFSNVNKQIKNGIISKNIANGLVISLFVFWIIYLMIQPPKTHSTYLVNPKDSIVTGNLSNYITIRSDTCIITHRKPGESYNWQVDVKMYIKRLFCNNRNVKFDIKFILTDEKGIPYSGFEPAELSKESMDLFASQILNQDKIESYFRFLIKNSFDHPENIDTIPPFVTKFIIKADSISRNK